MPINIYVSKGLFDSPPYKFYLDENGNQELNNLTLDPSESYLFKRLNNSNSHPFYISDIGYEEPSSNKISLTGDGSATNGIKGNQSLLLSFNEGSESLEKLYFFCTSHQSMISSFNIGSTQSGEISQNINSLNYDQDTSSLEDVDWNTWNSSNKAQKLYNSIDWATEYISTEVAADLDFSMVNFKKLNLDNLQDINDLDFTDLGKNYKKLKWDEINYSALSDASKIAIDWAQVDLKKAAKADSFTLDTIDWVELNSSTKAVKLYNSIDWATEYISKEVAADLDFSKVNFKKLNLDNLEDINDLDFTDLGKNYKKLKWDQINYSALSEDSKKAIDWTEINPKLASHAETFSLDTIDWDEISSHKVEVELYKLITEAMLEEASKETLSKLNTDLLNENNLLPSSSFFSEIPEPFGNYEILAGSSGTDEITGLPGQFIFFGEESDNIISKKGEDKLNIFYGTGQYKFEKGTFTVAYTGGLYDITNFKKNKLKMWEISDGSEWGSFENNPLFITDGITKLLISNPEIYQPFFKIGKEVFSNPLNENLGDYYQGSATSESLQNSGYLNSSIIQPLLDNNLAIFQTNDNLII